VTPPTNGAHEYLLPLYVLIDVSFSMARDGKIHAANEITPGLADALALNPVVADKVRIGVVSFADSARVEVPLSDLSTLHAMPALRVRGETSFAGAFAFMADLLAMDLGQVMADGYIVHRPVIFVVTDGEPGLGDHGWRDSLAALVADDGPSPYVIPLSVGGDLQVLAELIHPRDKMRLIDASRGDWSAAEGIGELADLLVSSTISSALAVSPAERISQLLSGDLPEGLVARTYDDLL
jgi:uncharacterized protein YegL